MKLISTLFSTQSLEFTLTIQSRNSRGNTDEVPNEPLIMRYKSRIGNESLIFNPSIAIVIRNKEIREVAKTAWITQQLFYRFVTSLTVVYQGLNDSKLYTVDNNVTYMDKKRASEISTRMSLFRNSLTISPCVIEQGSSYIKGVSFVVDNSPIGSMTHLDTLSILELLEHFDLTTFSLLSGVVDEMEMMNSKLDLINLKMDTIIKLIQDPGVKDRYGPKPVEGPTLNWEPLPGPGLY